MKRTVFANTRSVSTKGTNDLAHSTAPDVCITLDDKLVTPDNWIRTKHLKTGKTVAVTIADNSIWTSEGLLDEKPSKPTHDGIKGGVKSKTYRGYASPASYSPDVFFEDGAAVRMDDKTFQNNGNTVGVVMGAEGRDKLEEALRRPGPWDIACILQIFCNGDTEDKAVIGKLPLLTVHRRHPKQVHYKEFVGGQWIDGGFPSGGSADGRTVWINNGSSCAHAASTMFHEVVHTDQPDTIQGAHVEYDAYIKTEQWRIKMDLGPYLPGTRMYVDGIPLPDPDAMKGEVDKIYKYNPPAELDEPPPPRVLGLAANGTDVRMSDGTERAPREGDAYRLDDTGGEIIETVDPEVWKCP